MTGHRIEAAGPIVQGSGTNPHRVVLVTWLHQSVITKFSTHVQAFEREDSSCSGPLEPFGKAYLTDGDYATVRPGQDPAAQFATAVTWFRDRVRNHLDSGPVMAGPMFPVHRYRNHGGTSE